MDRARCRAERIWKATVLDRLTLAARNCYRTTIMDHSSQKSSPRRLKRLGLHGILFCIAWLVIQPFADPSTSMVSAQEIMAEEDLPCVLLKNDSVIYGMAYQVGESIVIRRGDPKLNQQSELRLPRTAVACWADSIRDLYRYRVDHREVDHFETHLRDAQWCLQNGLLDLSKTELQAAKAFRPGSLVVARLEERIEHAIALPIQDAVWMKDSQANESHPSFAATVGHEEDSLVSAGVDDHMMGEFARSVQVTLINRCGNCHSKTSDRSWKIALPPGKSRASAELTYENVLAILPFIDADQPLASPLLDKATAYHGGSTYRTAEAPLSIRHGKAIESLKRWLLQMGHEMRQQNAGEPLGDGLSMNHASSPFSSADFSSPQNGTGDAYFAAKQAETAGNTTREITPANNAVHAAPLRMPKVDNPFDPELFNRQFHR